MSKEALLDLEDRLANLLGRRYCLLVGRATTAIYLGLKALNPSGGGKVILPALVCPSPANAAIYAGMEPIFCDVSLTDANMDIESCRTVLEQEDNVNAIILVHLFGHVANLAPLLDLAKEFNVPVIEDAAQAMGGRYSGKPLGSWGDVSVISFGYSKIIDTGSGGALLTDDEEIARLAKTERESLPNFSPRITQLAEEQHRLYYALKPLREQNRRLEELLFPIPHIYKEIYLYGTNNLPLLEISNALPELPIVISDRNERANLYRKLLSHPDIVHFDLRKESVPWRFSFRVLGHDREIILDQMRSSGFDISAWYPPINQWYISGTRQQSLGTAENSITIGKEIINLWVNPDISLHRIEETCQAMNLLIGRPT